MKQDLKVKIDNLILEGTLTLPSQPLGAVVFAHGSGSSRFSPRNRFVAQILHQGGIGTLLFDLLTPDEETIPENRFNIALLSDRLDKVLHWLKLHPKTHTLTVGLFGASTGAAAALRVAAHHRFLVKAIVLRGGRPDLASEFLSQVKAPTLLIVGGHDWGVIELNQQAFSLLRCPKKIAIIPGATHLFEEEGALEQVAELALAWFRQYLVSATKQSS